MLFSGVMSDRMLCVSLSSVWLCVCDTSMPGLHSNEANNANDNRFTIWQNVCAYGGAGDIDVGGGNITLFQLRAHITSKNGFRAISTQQMRDEMRHAWQEEEKMNRILNAERNKKADFRNEIEFNAYACHVFASV